MASSELGGNVDTELTALSINTHAEVKTFRALPRARTNDMVTVLANINAARGKQWTSRKRVRSDALRLLNEGQL